MTQLGSKKSRKGCTNCKRRRVKCNEETPCANCRRRGEACSLTTAPSPSSISNREPLDDALPSSTEEWMQDMELMHHYHNFIGAYLDDWRPEIRDVWQNLIPSEALRHPFLMHGLLTMSALSLAHGRPAESAKYVRLADKHQAVALSGFRAALAGEITEDVSSALFALSSCISVSSAARACTIAASMPATKFIDIDNIVEGFILTRGVREVINVARDYIEKSPISAMTWGHSMPADEEESVRLPTFVVSQFDMLQEMLDVECVDQPENLEHCSMALQELKDLFRHLRYFAIINRVDKGRIWRWTTAVPQEYLQLVKAKYQPALVVMLYFAAVNSLARNTWFVTDWSKYAVQGISMELDEKMQKWLEWPRQQMRENFSALRDET